MKWINARFPDELHEEIAAAATAEERPIGSWLRIAAKEKLARKKFVESKPEANFEIPLADQEEMKDCISGCDWRGHPIHVPGCPNFKKGGKK
jgi:hypothetical protein